MNGFLSKYTQRKGKSTNKLLGRDAARRTHQRPALSVGGGVGGGGRSLTLQGLQTLARLDVPDLDGGVGVARDQDVVLQLHAAGERLVARQRVDAVARLHVPHSDGRVQRAAHHVDPVELQATGSGG